MKKIVNTLIEFGIDFNFQSYGIRGSKVSSNEIELTVKFEDGMIYLTYGSENEEFSNSKFNRKLINTMVEEICIELI